MEMKVINDIEQARLIKELKELLKIDFEYDIIIRSNKWSLEVNFLVVVDEAEQDFNKRYAFGQDVSFRLTPNEYSEQSNYEFTFEPLGGMGRFEPFNLSQKNYQRLCGLRLQARVVEELHLMNVLAENILQEEHLLVK